MMNALAVQIGAIGALIFQFPLLSTPAQLYVKSGHDSAVKHDMILSGPPDPDPGLILKVPALNRGCLDRMKES